MKCALSLPVFVTIVIFGVPAAAQEVIGPGGTTTPTTPAAPAPAAAATVAPSATNDDISGFEFGIRLGLQAPGGKMSSLTGGGFDNGQNTPLSDFTGSGFDFILDVGHRVNRTFYYGFQLSLAPSLGAGSGDPGTSIHNLRVGADLMVHPQIHTLPDALDPYFGFGVNYDSLTLSQGGTSISVYGMEFANLQVGVDYLVTPAVSAGVFFSTSFAMYFGADQADTQNAELHEWFTFGIRGAYRL
jgi:hypothetical protein